jgi:hypothetical protein
MGISSALLQMVEQSNGIGQGSSNKVEHSISFAEYAWGAFVHKFCERLAVSQVVVSMNGSLKSRRGFHVSIITW